MQEVLLLPINLASSNRGWQQSCIQVDAPFQGFKPRFLTHLPLAALLLTHFLLVAVDGQHTVVGLDGDVVGGEAGGICVHLKAVVQLLNGRSDHKCALLRWDVCK